MTSIATKMMNKQLDDLDIPGVPEMLEHHPGLRRSPVGLPAQSAT
jgi:hypothetical protein